MHGRIISSLGSYVFAVKISPFDAGCCLLCGIWIRLLESLVASKRWIIIIINMMDFALLVFGSQPLKRFIQAELGHSAVINLQK